MTVQPSGQFSSAPSKGQPVFQARGGEGVLDGSNPLFITQTYLNFIPYLHFLPFPLISPH